MNSIQSPPLYQRVLDYSCTAHNTPIPPQSHINRYKNHNFVQMITNTALLIILETFNDNLPLHWVRFCKPFREPRNRFPAWRNRFPIPGRLKLLQIWALLRTIRIDSREIYTKTTFSLTSSSVFSIDLSTCAYFTIYKWRNYKTM